MKREDFVRDLRALADFYEQNLLVPVPTNEAQFNAWLHGDDAAEKLAEIARTIGPVEKHYFGQYFTLRKCFGAVQLDFNTLREQVCQRKVVGTKHVEEEVIPAHEEEIVEWDCSEPILAKGKEESVAS